MTQTSFFVKPELILKLIENATKLVLDNGRIFYIGSGTSGRLGIVDASECLPTFGIDDKIFGRESVSICTTAAALSSQLLSIPRTVIIPDI